MFYSIIYDGKDFKTKMYEKLYSLGELETEF